MAWWSSCAGSRGAALPGLLAGILAASRAGFASLKLDVVVVRDQNDDGLGNLVRLAWRHGAIPRLIELMPYGRGEPVPVAEMKARLRADGIHLAPDVVRGWGPAERLVGEDERPSEPRSGPLRLIGAMSPAGCGDCNRVRVGLDGALRRCLARPVETPLRDLLRRGAGPDDLVPRIRDALAARWPDASSGPWQIGSACLIGHRRTHPPSEAA